MTGCIHQLSLQKTAQFCLAALTNLCTRYPGQFPPKISPRARPQLTTPPAPPSAGKLLWKFKTGGRVQTQGALGPDGTAYFGSGDGKVYALGAVDGSLQVPHATRSFTAFAAYKAHCSGLSSPAAPLPPRASWAVMACSTCHPSTGACTLCRLVEAPRELPFGTTRPMDPSLPLPLSTRHLLLCSLAPLTVCSTPCGPPRHPP
jgi:hypothetical protein